MQYGNALKVVRAVTGNKNATSDGTGLQIKNTDHYLNNYSDGSASNGSWGAREAGTEGNNLKVSMCTNSSAYASAGGGSNLVNDANAAIGDTAITIDDGGGVLRGHDSALPRMVPRWRRFWWILISQCELESRSDL